MEAVKSLPSKEIRLETADATYFHFKTDIFRRLITYSTDKRMAVNLVTIDADRAFEVIAMNKAGEKPLTLAVEKDEAKPKEKAAYGDLLGQDDLTRFDKKKKKKRKPQKQREQAEGKQPKAEQPQQPAQQQRDGTPQGGKRRNRNRGRGNRPAAEGGAPSQPKND